MNQDDKVLETVFSNDFQRQKIDHGYIPWIVDYANSLNPSLVIDVGCGRNLYKNQIQNLIGFDSSDYVEADFKSTILDATFDDNCADIVMALGSIQFVSFKFIRKNLEQITKWTKPGGHIIMRVTLKDQQHLEKIKVYNKKKLLPWTIDFLEEVTNNLNLEIVRDLYIYDVCYTSNNAEDICVKKIEWVWRKK